MPVHCHGATDQGLVRPANEDAFHVGSWAFAVADGVGGAPAGEVASRLAVEQVAALDDASPDHAQDARDRLVAAVGGAARAIREASAASPEHAGMATTLTAAGIHGDRLVLAHVGDSRAYLFRGGELERLTEDHTAVEEAVRAGLLAPGAAARHPERHLLVRVVGDDPEVPVATWPPRTLEPRDRVLLCSDGLTEPCDDAVIAEVLSGAPDAEGAVGALVDAALERGAPDNVTVVVADVVP